MLAVGLAPRSAHQRFASLSASASHPGLLARVAMHLGPAQSHKALGRPPARPQQVPHPSVAQGAIQQLIFTHCRAREVILADTSAGARNGGARRDRRRPCGAAVAGSPPALGSTARARRGGAHGTGRRALGLGRRAMRGGASVRKGRTQRAVLGRPARRWQLNSRGACRGRRLLYSGHGW